MNGIINCEICNKEFKYYRAEGSNPARYCSMRCFGHKKKKANCMRCNTEFSYWPSIRPNALYCSRRCHSTIQAKNYHTKRKEKINSLSNEQRLNLLKSAFDKYVVKKEGCWEWNGGKRKKYGRINHLGKTISAHRVSYMIHKGPIEGMNVLHKCDNPPCTNPEHLFLGTISDNTQDKIKKGRANFAVGERARSSNLTKEKVLEIRRLLDLGVTGVRLAKQYGVCAGSINDIKHRRTWKHI